MTDEDDKASGPHGDAAADLIHDLASDPPPKSLDTMKAASDAVEGEDRRDRIARRAYRLWEDAGRHHGSHSDHWREAEAEIAREDD